MSLDIPPALEARALTKQAWNQVLEQKKRAKGVNVEQVHDKRYACILSKAHKAATSLGELKLVIHGNPQLVRFCQEQVDFLTSQGFETMFEKDAVTLSWANASQGEALELRRLANELLDAREFKNMEKQTKRMSLSGQTSVVYTPAYREYDFCIQHREFVESRGFTIDQSKEKRLELQWDRATRGEGLKCLELAKDYHAKMISKTIKDAIHRAQNNCEYKGLKMDTVRRWYGEQFRSLAYTLQDPYLIRWR